GKEGADGGIVDLPQARGPPAMPRAEGLCALLDPPEHLFDHEVFPTADEVVAEQRVLRIRDHHLEQDDSVVERTAGGEHAVGELGEPTRAAGKACRAEHELAGLPELALVVPAIETGVKGKLPAAGDVLHPALEDVVR